jgi:uncharacterized membrane protein YuzA (DUF378 family)
MMDKLHKIAYVLLVVGGLNWGMIGFFDINVISNIFSNDLSRIIYSFVGVAALVGLYSVANMQGRQASAKKK